jgi:hypothetical protein
MNEWELRMRVENYGKITMRTKSKKDKNTHRMKIQNKHEKEDEEQANEWEKRMRTVAWKSRTKSKK